MRRGTGWRRGLRGAELALRASRASADLILANLLTHILEGMLRAGLGEALKPDGVLIAPGLPKHHAPLIQKAAATAGLRILEHCSLEGCLPSSPSDRIAVSFAGSRHTPQEGVFMAGFSSLIGRALLDSAFRAQLFNNPEAAMQGFDLTPQQAQTLRNMSPQQFDALVEQFAEQVPGPGVPNPGAEQGEAVMLEQPNPFGSRGMVIDGGKPAGLPDPGAEQGDAVMLEQPNPFGSQGAINDGGGPSNPSNPGDEQGFKEVEPGRPGDQMMKYLPLDGQGDASFAKYIPGVEKGGPSPHMQPGGRRTSFSWGALVGFLMLLVLLGFSFLLFGPVEAMQGGMGMVGLNFICPSDPSMGDGPVMPTNLGDQAPGGGDLTGVPDGSSNGMLNFTLGFLNFANGLRMSLGGESFLPPNPCMNPPAPLPAPEAGDSTGGSTGGATGGESGNPPDAPSTGGEQADSPGDAAEVCANNGGVQWQGQSCVCPGLIDNITLCADGSKIDEVTQQTCTPDQSCDQPADPGNPPACPCTRVCTLPSATAPDQCAQWEYRDCTGNTCRP